MVSSFVHAVQPTVGHKHTRAGVTQHILVGKVGVKMRGRGTDTHAHLDT